MVLTFELWLNWWLNDGEMMVIQCYLWFILVILVAQLVIIITLIAQQISGISLDDHEPPVLVHNCLLVEMDFIVVRHMMDPMMLAHPSLSLLRISPGGSRLCSNGFGWEFGVKEGIKCWDSSITCAGELAGRLVAAGLQWVRPTYATVNFVNLG